MAQVSPLNEGAAAPDGARLSLAGTLASLPQEWTALRDRNLDEDVIEAVLVHPDIGVAFVSMAPIAPEVAAARLRERLDDEHFEEFFPGTLPIVVLGITSPETPEVEQRLAAVFQQAPTLAITDRDWADAVVALLQASGYIEMTTPGSGLAAFQPEAIDSLGGSDPEVESAASPSFSRLCFLAPQADDNAAPPAPTATLPIFAAATEKLTQVAPDSRTGGRGHWGVPLVCVVVFVAELGGVFGLLEVKGLLPYSTSRLVRTETASLNALEAALMSGEPWREPAPEGQPVLQIPEPLIASSLEPPTYVAPAAVDWAQLKYAQAPKVSKVRRHRVNFSRAAPTTNSGQHHARNHNGHAVTIREEIGHGAIDLWEAAKAVVAAGGEKLKRHSDPRKSAKDSGRGSG
jgi:hypothetical protein